MLNLKYIFLYKENMLYLKPQISLDYFRFCIPIQYLKDFQFLFTGDFR